MAVWGTQAKKNKNTNLRVNDISIFFLKKKKSHNPHGRENDISNFEPTKGNFSIPL